MLCVMNNLKHTVFRKLRGSWLHAVQSVSRNLALQGSTVVSNLHIASPRHLIKGLICPYFIDKVLRQPWIQQPSQNPIAVTLQSYSHYSILPLMCKQTLARVNFYITNTLRSVPFLSRNTVSKRLNVPQRRVAMGLISTVGSQFRHRHKRGYDSFGKKKKKRGNKNLSVYYIFKNGVDIVSP